MADKKGIDISRYQGQPDFGKLKSEVDFVILQAGFGRYSSQKDAEFERGYAADTPLCITFRKTDGTQTLLPSEIGTVTIS